MSDSIIRDKSYQFALRIVRLCKELNEKKEYVLSREVLRAGTHIGARVKAGQQAESRPDFIHNFSVALQNAAETEYWLELLRNGGFIDQQTFNSLNEDCAEVIRLLTKIVKTSRENS
jgi:four helix bundle protein